MLHVAFTVNHAGQQIPVDRLARFAQRAEALGIDALLSGDHIVLPLEDEHDYPYTADGSFGTPATLPEGHLNDSVAVLAYLAGVTTKIQLGASVMVLPYRNPLLAAKAWASLDVLSDGRAICGVGVGWSQRAFEVLGVPFKERGAITNEYIEVMRELWEEEQPSYEGMYCQFKDIGFYPKPVQRPLPLWVGGYTKAAVRRAVKYGDCWHLSRKVPDYAAGLIPFLRECAEANGRDPRDIAISLKRRLHFTDLDTDPGPDPFTDYEVVGSVDDVIRDARHCLELGITQLTYDFRTADVDEQIAVMERFAEHVLPAVAG